MKRVLASAPLMAALVFAAYVGLEQIGFTWFQTDAGPTFFPPAGLTLAALALQPSRRWPALLCAVGVAEFATDIVNDVPAAACVGYAITNMAEPLVGATIIRRMVGDIDLARRAGLVAFLAGGVLAGPIVGGMLGATTSALVGGEGVAWAESAVRWWLGDALGVLVVGSSLLAWLSPKALADLPTRRQVIEGLIGVAACVGALGLVFRFNEWPLAYVPVVLLVLVAFRLGVRWVALAGSATAFLLAAQASLAAHDFWDQLNVGRTIGIVHLQLLAGVLIATNLGLAVEVAERERASAERAAAERASEAYAEQVRREQASRQRMERIAALAAALSAASDMLEIGRAMTLHGAALAGATAAAVEEVLPGGAYGMRHVPESGETVVSVPVSGVAGSPRTALTFRWAGSRDVDAFAMRELETIADMVAPALARTRLLTAERDARRRTEILHELAADLSAAALPEDVAEAAAPHVLEALGASRCSIVLVGEERLDAYSADADDREPGWSAWPRISDRIRMAQPPGGGTYVEAHGREGLAERYSPGIVGYLADELGIESLIIAPLPKGLGRVTAMYRRPREIEPADRTLLMTVARLVGQAVERAELHRAEHAARELEARGRARSELLAALIGQLEEEHGVTRRAQRLVEVLVPRLADFALVETSDPEPVTLALRHGEPEGADRLAALLQLRTETEAADAGEPQLIEAGTGHWLDGLGARSSIVVPLQVSGSTSDPLRLVLALTDSGRRPYDVDDLAFARDLAGRASLSIESARLLEQEHATAVAFQRALLPDTLIRHARLAVAARYLPADSRLQVGGDWYDAMALPDGRVAFSVGDVVGKGLQSAVTMGTLRTAMSALAGGTHSPAALLAQLDDFASRTEGARFATAAYAVLDPATGVLQHASAGHPPILIAYPDGTTRYLEDGRSWPLGSPAGRPRAEGVTRLDVGATLILYSDGLIERRRDRVSRGLEALQAAVSRHATLRPDELCAAVIGALCGDGRGVQDDIVVLAARLLPAPVPAFRQTLTLNERELAALRRRLRGWMDREAVPAPVRARLLLGVGEACANALEHAYAGTAAGEIEISIVPDGEDTLLVTIRDDGRWRPRTRRADRGRGTALMRSVADGFERRSGAAGTTVTLRYRLPVAAPL